MLIFILRILLYFSPFCSETRPLRCSRSFPSSIQCHCRTNQSRPFVHGFFYVIRPLVTISSDRKKVLKHHPDKKAGNSSSVVNSLYLAGVNQNTNDDAFFKCIQKAHEVLTNAEKRRQFDSVDPDFVEFEDNLPNAGDFKVVLVMIL